MRQAVAQGMDRSTVLALLEENHPVYQGLDVGSLTRIRGGLLYELSRHALTDEAQDYLLEELESPHDSYLTALAAWALRKAIPHSRQVAPVLRAYRLMSSKLEPVTLEPFERSAPGAPFTTAAAETMRTLEWLRENGLIHLTRNQLADDRFLLGYIEELEFATIPQPQDRGMERLPDIILQDQDGSKVLSREFFSGCPSLVVFFYTRCDNLAKCPATIRKLARLQREDFPLKTAAITYDPAYDNPERLSRFADLSGMEPSPRHRMFRTVGDFRVIRDFFGLSVGYSVLDKHATLPNRHAVEAFVLDSEAFVVQEFHRRTWSEGRLQALARKLAPSQL